MSLASTVRERFAGWLEAEDDGALARFRAVFAWIWVVYDAIDLAWGMTERSRVWFPHDRTPGLAALQVVLVASGVALALGRGVWVAGMIAAVARCAEAFEFFSLNDFFFVSVVDLLLAHSRGGPFERGRAPRWVRDALLAQFGWTYLATGLLKLNPDWLNGGQLFVRSQYLWTGHGWPYPAAMERALASIQVDAWLSKLGVASELLLGALLFARGPYWLAVALVVGVHTVGAMITNVWFFSASMVAGVVFLLPHGPRGRGRGRALS